MDTRAVMRCVDDAQTYCSPGGLRTCTRKIYGSLLRGQTWHQMEGPGCGMAISVVFSTEGRAHFSADETGMARNAAWGLLLCNGRSRRSAEECRAIESGLGGEIPRATAPDGSGLGPWSTSQPSTASERGGEAKARDTEGVATDMEAAKQMGIGPEGIRVV